MEAHGGYELARDARQITADDILRAIRTIDDDKKSAAVNSRLLAHVVVPQLAQAEVAFSTALARVNVEDLMRAAEGTRRSAALQTILSVNFGVEPALPSND